MLLGEMVSQFWVSLRALRISLRSWRLGAFCHKKSKESQRRKDTTTGSGTNPVAENQKGPLSGPRCYCYPRLLLSQFRYPAWFYAEPSAQHPQSALGISGRVVQGDQFPRRVVLCSKRIRGVRVNYRQDISAADSTENEVLLVNGDNSVSFVEYRIVVHGLLDARFLTTAHPP